MSAGGRPPLTDFGFRRVPPGEKTRRIDAVFGSVAARYDLMNDLMSWGTHRLWKRFAVAVAAPRPGQRVLDLAAGTGDLTRRLARRVTPRGLVVAADPSAEMLARGRDRLLDAGHVRGLAFVRARAEALPLPDAAFDLVTIGFGLRNCTDRQAALQSMWRVLRPGGRMVVLEFSRPALHALRPLYDAYSFQVIPRLGAMVVGDADAYRYLVESIRRHPDQQTLAQEMRAAGFERVRWHNLSGGIVAVHTGVRL